MESKPVSKKRTGYVVVCAAVVIAGSYWLLRPRQPRLPDAYVGERTATVWNTLAAVRQPVATLRFGERLGVVERRGDEMHVRLVSGETGWIESRVLMDAGLWERSAKLLEQTRKMPVQAAGQTKVATNVRVEAGRTAARLFQFGRDVPVDILGKATAEWGSEENTSRPVVGEDQKPRREDWLLVRGRAPMGAGNRLISMDSASAAAPNSPEEIIEVAGWVVARFIELDPPATIKDYASSSGMRVRAWFELNRVPAAGPGAGGEKEEKPQYLVAGVRGGEGQACDFNVIRVYTWGASRRRYETAFGESDLCGYLPIRVGRSAAGEPEFRFQAQQKNAREERVYRMRQTSVRRVREPAELPKPKRR